MSNRDGRTYGYAPKAAEKPLMLGLGRSSTTTGPSSPFAAFVVVAVAVVVITLGPKWWFRRDGKPRG